MLFTPVLTGSYFELIYYIAPRSSYVDWMSGWPSSNGMIITTAHPLSNQYSPDRVYHLLTRELYHSGLFFFIRDPSQILDIRAHTSKCGDCHPHLSPPFRGGRPSTIEFTGLATRNTSMLFTPVLTGSYFELIYYIVFAVVLCRLDVRITCGNRPPNYEMSATAAHVLIYPRCYDPAIVRGAYEMLLIIYRHPFWGSFT